MDFEVWIQEVYDIAYAVDLAMAYNVSEYPFMYEDYYDQGLTPQQAFEAEWVN